jgi:hypothetical protein
MAVRAANIALGDLCLDGVERPSTLNHHRNNFYLAPSHMVKFKYNGVTLSTIYTGMSIKIIPNVFSGLISYNQFTLCGICDLFLTVFGIPVGGCFGYTG